MLLFSVRAFRSSRFIVFGAPWFSGQWCAVRALLNGIRLSPAALLRGLLAGFVSGLV